MLGLDRLRGADRVGRGDQLVIEDVATLAHRHLDSGVANHDDVLERLEVAHRLIDGFLDGRGLALAPRAVDRDQCLRGGDLHAFLHGLRSEPPEHHVVRRADPRAGEHRHNDLGDHRQIDPDDVALAYAQLLERIGQSLHLVEELEVGDRALLALLARPIGTRRGPLGPDSTCRSKQL